MCCAKATGVNEGKYHEITVAWQVLYTLYLYLLYLIKIQIIIVTKSYKNPERVVVKLYVGYYDNVSAYYKASHLN